MYRDLSIFNLLLNGPTILVIYYEKNPLHPQWQALGLYCLYNFYKTDKGGLKLKSAL